jgi:hypothetical protein
VAADDAPTFAIPERPTRRYRRRGGLEYEGGTVFALRPRGSLDEPALASLVESVLEGDSYRYGDWFDLPMPLYLAHDDRTGDSFRVAIRDGTVELHVLPETDREGLRAFHERLVAASSTTWDVTRRTE